MYCIKKIAGVLLTAGALSLQLQGQPLPAAKFTDTGSQDSASVHLLKHNRLCVLMYHNYANTETTTGQHLLIIPAIGLDYDYWFSDHWGLGLHNDLVITHKVNQEISSGRAFPLLATIDGLWKPYKGLVFMIGPGVEFESRDHYFFMRGGIEYEIEFGSHWDICPTLFYDTRNSSLDTYSFGLGIGKRF